jgi:hypothetical protein
VIERIHFNIKNKRYKFAQFNIAIRNIEWWNMNAQVLEDNSAWLKGSEYTLHTSLGIYLGKNNNFVFTLNPNNQSCPDLGEDPAPLCDLVREDEKMIQDSLEAWST